VYAGFSLHHLISRKKHPIQQEPDIMEYLKLAGALLSPGLSMARSMLLSH
jgi:hypothetical protein